jgi:3-oxoadipate enol-lactonase
MNLATRVQGEGPAVIWLHGYTMQSSLWSELWSLLPGWRHVGVDLPGHGGSPPLETGTTLPDLAADIARVATQHESSRMVALSFGTMVALQVAIDHPALIGQLVLAAPALAGGGSEPGADARYIELIRLYREGASGAELVDTWMRSPPDIFEGTQTRPVLRFRLRQTILRHRWTELATGAMAGLTRHPQTTEQLAALRTQLCVLVGDQDMPLTREVSIRLADTAPGAERVVLPGVGHLCLLEDPARAAPLIHQHLLGGPDHAS